jgi:hypothetical protein
MHGQSRCSKVLSGDDSDHIRNPSVGGSPCGAGLRRSVFTSRSCVRRRCRFPRTAQSLRTNKLKPFTSHAREGDSSNSSRSSIVLAANSARSRSRASTRRARISAGASPSCDSPLLPKGRAGSGGVPARVTKVASPGQAATIENTNNAVRFRFKHSRVGASAPDRPPARTPAAVRPATAPADPDSCCR